MNAAFRWVLLLWVLVAAEAGAAVTMPADEPPTICGRKLDVSPELSWRTLWTELRLPQVLRDPGSLPAAEVPRVVRGVATKFRALHAPELARPDAQLFLSVLDDVAQGRRTIASVDWGVVANMEDRRVDILETEREGVIRFDCRVAEAPVMVKDDIARLTRVMEKIQNFAATAPLLVLSETVALREKQANDLLRNGLTMTPWEMKLNERFLSDDDAASGFSRQIVFLRPSGGAEINTRSRADASLQGSLALEPIGMVWYLDPQKNDYREWVGVSALLTSSTDGGLGYGVLVRYGNYSAGLALHSGKNGGGDDVYLFLGVDLLNLLDSKRPSLEAFVDKYKAVVRRVNPR